MKTLTKYFGEIEYEAEEVLSFPNGVYGFEDEKRFLLLPFEGDGSLYCFQSLQTPGLAFVAVDPFTLLPDYAPVLQPGELKAMGVEDSKELFYFSFCVVKDPASSSTVNLKCPIALNEDTREASQVILEDQPYGMRHILSDMENQEVVSC